MRRLLTITLLLCALANVAMAQRITHNFNNVSMSDALKYIQQQTTKHKIVFIYNELEDFMVTTSVKGKSVPDAIKQVIGFYPIRMTQSGNNEIYVECTHKSNRHLTGKIVDEKGLPLEFADVRLLNPSDSSYITGGVTNASGIFVIPLDKSQVIAKFSYIGYKPVYKLCSRENVGTIQLQVKVIQLGEVTVKGAKRLVRSTERGLIANVQGTVLENFGSVNDMLSHLPLMMSDGTIAGHGKPEIYINNKKVRDVSELDRYRADEILSAEIITNPGPEYGQDVKSVIRLKTVRKAGEGLSGNIGVNYRKSEVYWSRLNGSLNYRLKNGMDFFVRGQLTDGKSSFTNKSIESLGASSLWKYDNDYVSRSKATYYVADMGWDWEISDNHSIGFTYTRQHNFNNANQKQLQDTKVWRDNESWDEGQSFSEMTFKPQTKHSVNAYYIGKLGNWSLDFSADYYGAQTDFDMLATFNGVQTGISNTKTKERLLAEKLIVTAPVQKGELTFGEEMTGVNRYNDFVQDGFATDNHIHQQSSSWSLFANYVLSIQKFSFNTGLRWQNEYNNYYIDGKLNNEMSPNYHVFIPRASIGYQNGDWQHTLSYQTTRYNPPYGTLSSTIRYDGKYDYFTGNPFLQPQAHSDISWESKWKWAYFSLSYERIKDIYTNFYTAYDEVDHPGVKLNTFRTIPSANLFLLTLNLSPRIGIWQMNYSAYLYFQDCDLEPLGITHKFNGLVSDFTLDNTFSFPHSWTLNVKASLSPYHETMCKQEKTSGRVDLRLTKRFLKDKSLTVTMVANDIFHTDKTRATTYNGLNYCQDINVYRDVRDITINVSWKFNATRSRYKGSHAGQSERNRL